MEFKLGSNRGNKDFKLKIGGSNHETVGGIRVERVEMPEGTMGEAHKEGVIYIDENIDPGSEQYRRVLNHEMKHMTHLKLGRVEYDDTYIRFDGVTYPRENGYIHFEGEWVEEGDVNFPWEFKD
jgi:hypothetical protein